MKLKEVFEKQPDNQRILEILATAEQSEGNEKDALSYYEQLYPKTKDLYHLYQIITIQYDLKRLAECNANIDLMLALFYLYKNYMCKFYYLLL